MIFARSLNENKSTQPIQLPIASLLRKNLWALLLLFIAMFFAMPIYDILTAKAYMPTDDLVLYFGPFDGTNTFLSITTLCFGIINAFNFFGYLHRGKQIDFFHALPIERGKLFLANYLSANLIFVFSFVVNALVAYVLILSLSDYGNFQPVARTFVHHLLFYNLFLLTTTLAILITGTRLTSFLVALSLFESVQLILMSVLELARSYWYTLASDWGYLTSTSFITMLFSLLLPVEYGILLLIAVVLYFICCRLFEARPSELCGNPVWGKITAQAFKYISLFALALLGGMIFRSVSYDDSMLLMFVGATATGFFGHLIIEGILHSDIKRIFANWPAMILFLVLTNFFFYAIVADLFGYDRRFTAPENVAYYTIDFARDFSSDKPVLLQTQTDETKAIVARYIQASIEEVARRKHMEKNGDYNFYSFGDEYYGYFTQMQIFSVKPKTGFAYRRSYPFAREIRREFEQAIYERPEYKSMLLSLIREAETDHNAQLETFDNPDYAYAYLKEHDKLRLINALCTDIAETTGEEFANTKARINVQFFSKPLAQSSWFSIPIYDCYDHTLAVLGSLPDFDSEPLNLEMIESVYWSSEDQHLDPLVEPEKVQYLIDHYTPEQHARYYPYLEVDYRDVAEFTLKNGTRLSFYKIIE